MTEREEEYEERHTAAQPKHLRAANRTAKAPPPGWRKAICRIAFGNPRGWNRPEFNSSCCKKWSALADDFRTLEFDVDVKRWPIPLSFALAEKILPV
jgi:hypothetical protein